MFIVYHSNNLELFIRFMINIMSSYSLSNPMQSEIILTTHKMMGQWIEIKLADYFGIAANIVFMSIQSFINRIFKELSSNDCIMHNFSYDFIYWKLMKILPNACLSNNCDFIKKFLHNDIDQQKCSQLAEQLSDLFIQYLIYRSDWLDIWQSNKIVEGLDIEHQIWQSEIWRMLLKNNSDLCQKLSSLNCCINDIQKDVYKINYNHFPNRIFICGVTSLPPIYWKLLHLLSDHLDIYLWLIRPCINNWNDTNCYNVSNVNHKELVLYSYNQWRILCKFFKISCHYNNDFYVFDNYIKQDHFLLNTWGKTGLDTLYMLNQLNNLIEIKAFVIPVVNSILRFLQRDILEFKQYILNINKKCSYIQISKNQPKYTFSSDDQSVSIHVCTNIQREVEVLHDNLLLMLSNEPSLLFGEIIVMAPNIKHYESAIQNVFNNIFDRKLPFAILNKNNIKSMHPIISSFLDILNISHMRCTAEEILSFLSVSSVSSRFNINAEELNLLHQWVIESGIRWGLDEDTMLNFDLPISNQNTWFFGLQRILLGYAIKSDNETWKGIFPYDGISIEHIDIINKLAEFLIKLRKWRNRLSSSYTLNEWIAHIQEIINDFFYCADLDEEENKAIFLLRSVCNDILKLGVQFGYNNNISAIILKNKLSYKFNQSIKNYQFLPNVINFCDIIPICYVPCKVLCLIGMNEDSFPRNEVSLDLNLISKKPRISDEKIREKDCYAFLLAMLLPKDRIYISFLTNSVIYKTNNPSILVDRFLEFFGKNCWLIGDQDVDNNNIQRVRQHLLTWHSCIPFDPDNFIFNSKKSSFATEWLHAASINVNSNKSIYFSFLQPLPQIAIDKIMFSDLYNFYRHPIRIWFQKRLGVFYNQNNFQLCNNEPFFTNYLHRFKINIKLINYLIHGKNINFLYDESYASGILPHGAFGKLFWIKQCEQMTILVNQIKRYYSFESDNLHFVLKLNAIKLVGKLSRVQKIGLVRWKPSYLSMKDCFLLWLEHLIYCAIGKSGDSWLFGINSMWHFSNLSKLESKELLCSLILDYCNGMNIPLMLLYKSGGAWINHVFDRVNKNISLNLIDQRKARQKLIQTWQGSDSKQQRFYCIGEYQDPYLRKIIPFHLSDNDIQNIIKTAKHFFLPVLKNRVL